MDISQLIAYIAMERVLGREDRADAFKMFALGYEADAVSELTEIPIEEVIAMEKEYFPSDPTIVPLGETND